MTVAPPPVTDPLERLEGRLAEFASALSRLEARVAVLEAAPAPAPVTLTEEDLDESTLAALLPGRGTVSILLTEIGRSFLLLGGGFLVRAVTEQGTIPKSVGVAAGIAYAVVWMALADRLGREGRARSAAFLSVTAVLLAYPLLWETATRMHVLGPAGAALGIAAMAALGLTIAWRRHLWALAWATVIAASLTAFFLSLQTGRPEPFAAALLAIAFGTSSRGDEDRRWRGIRWPAAAAADLLVLWMALRAHSSRPAPGGQSAGLVPFFIFALALPLFSLASFGVRSLRQRREISTFEMAQTVAALAIGFGGAVAVTGNLGKSAAPLGVMLLVLAAGCYFIAFHTAERSRNSRFSATIAFGLTLFGSSVLWEDAPRGLLWSLLALAAAFVGRSRMPTIWHVQAAAYAVAAAWQTGLLGSSVAAFVSGGSRAGEMIPLPALGALAGAVIGYLVIGGETEGRNAGGRGPAFLLGLVGAFGISAVAVSGLRSLLPQDASVIAALRTAVLSLLAPLLGWARRRTGRAELDWLASAALLAGALILLAEALPQGRPSTLFVAFALYGCSLLWTQRLRHRISAPRP